MVTRLRLSLYILPSLCFLMTVGCMTGCSRQAVNPAQNKSAEAPLTSPGSGSGSAQKTPQSAIVTAGETVAQALFGDGGGPRLAALQTESVARRVTLAELPKPAFDMDKPYEVKAAGIIILNRSHSQE
jgi:hypothetical protein